MPRPDADAMQTHMPDAYADKSRGEHVQHAWTKNLQDSDSILHFGDARAQSQEPESAADFLTLDPFLPAREAAIRWDLPFTDVVALTQDDLECMWRNQGSVCRPLFELIPDMADHHYVAGFGCSVCEPRR